MFNIGNAEILQIAESVAREKGIKIDLVISAMEQAIEVAGRRKYGNEHNVCAEINMKNGEIKLEKVLEVVEEVEDNYTQISLQDALIKNPEVKIGDTVTESLPPIDLGRVAAQTAKQIIVQKVRDAERDKQFEDFQNRAGEILNGTVKRVEFGDVVIDLGRAEAVIKRDQLIRGENFRINDRIKAYVQDVRREKSGPQIFMSRSDNSFIIKLFELEVPEIYDNIIEVKAIARDPGSKAKMAVYTADSSLDAVGSCVGVKGSRVRAITAELGGEKIDVISWSDDLAQLTINALAPAEISKVVIDEANSCVDVVVAEDQLSIAIGRRGQNVRLASKIIGWNINVLTEEQESKRRADEFNTTTQLFVEALDIEEVIAQLLTVEGYNSMEQIVVAEAEDLAAIDGFDIELVQELQKRALEYIEKENSLILSQLEDLGVEQELLDVLESVELKSILRMAEAGIKTIEDMGEITVDEFQSLAPNSGLSSEQIAELINAAKDLDNAAQEG